jgi:hypothetical protein
MKKRRLLTFRHFLQYFYMSCTAEDVKQYLFRDVVNLFIIMPRDASNTIGWVVCGTLPT